MANKTTTKKTTESEKKKHIKERINIIAKESFNAEQKQIAKQIIDNTKEEDLDAVWGLINQRVKTGFVFDEAPEVNHNCVAYIKENEKLGINLNKKNVLEHALIIGENYDALKNLLVVYTDKQGKGLVDVIYIDPPYNTEKTKEEGNDYKDDVEASKFIYRDKYTRDGWLNMMNERLKLAKKLLSDDGVIFISIDDSEQAYLKVLCDEIFGEENFESFIWQKKGGAGNTEKIIGCLTEYILCYFKKKRAGIFKYRDIKREYTLKDKKGPYNLAGIEKTNAGVYERPTMLFDIIDPKTSNIYKPSKDMRWTIGEKSINKMIKEGKIYFDDKKKKVYQIKRPEDYEKSENVYYNLLLDLGSLSSAKDELEEIFNNREIFDTPKPTELIKELLKISTRNDSVVLDFFAGSGTTGQAVMELNEEDGGTRKFILATNNENDIAKKVTRERLYRIINGKGSKKEKFKWEYNKSKKYLSNNSVRVFDIEKSELNITETKKAEMIRKEAELNFTKLDNKYKKKDVDIYYELSCLSPQKKRK